MELVFIKNTFGIYNINQVFVYIGKTRFRNIIKAFDRDDTTTLNDKSRIISDSYYTDAEPIPPQNRLAGEVIDVSEKDLFYTDNGFFSQW